MDVIFNIDQAVYTATQFYSEESIAKVFSFTIDIILDDFNYSNFFLGNSACLQISHQNQTRYISGIITEHIYSAKNENLIKIILKPRLALLELSTGPVFYAKKNIKEILQWLLINAGYMPAQIQWRAKIILTTEDWLQLPDETHLNFLARICQKEGVFYFFDQEKEIETIVFADDYAFCPRAQNKWLAKLSNQLNDPQDIFQMQNVWQMIPQQLMLQQHGLDDHEKTNHIDIVLADHLQGNYDFYNEDENVIKHAMQANQQTFILKSRNPICFPGKLIELDNQSFSATANTIFITDIKSHWQSTTELALMENHQVFTSHIHCLPENVIFAAPKKPLSVPIFPLPALIESLCDGDYPELNLQGFYRVRYGFDDTSSELLPIIRACSPHAGPITLKGGASGWHSPLMPGVEVLVGFVDDDPMQPIILGALPNEDFVSVVNSENANEHIWQSMQKNKLLMNDEDLNQKISFSNLNNLHHMQKTPIPEIRLQTLAGVLQFDLAQAIFWQAQGDLIEDIAKTRKCLVANNIFFKSGNLIQQQVGGNAYLNAKQNFNLNANEINLTANHQVNKNCQEELNLQANHAINLQALNGSVTLSSKNNMNIFTDGSQTIDFLQGNAKIQWNDNDELILEAENLALNAEQKIIFKGKLVFEDNN